MIIIIFKQMEKQLSIDNAKIPSPIISSATLIPLWVSKIKLNYVQIKHSSDWIII